MAKLGNKNKVYIGVTANNATTYTWLTGEQTNSVNLNGNPIEVSDKSAAWQKFIQGLRGGTVEVTVYADNTDAQQKAVLKALNDGTSLLGFIGELSSGAPSDGIAFEAIVSNISDTNDNNAVSSRSMSLTINGAPSFYPALT